MMCMYLHLSSYVFQEIFIQGNLVKLGAGFGYPLSVSVLFEETFYNEKEESFSILCISRPIEKDDNAGKIPILLLGYIV